MLFSEALDRVRLFHRRVGAPVATEPCLLRCEPADAGRLATIILEQSILACQQGVESEDPLLLRLGMALEEIAEFAFAHVNGDLVGAADAWGDRCFVLFGDAVAMDLPVVEIFNETHTANMTKQPDIVTAHGKAIRGPDYRPPDIRGVLRARRLLP